VGPLLAVLVFWVLLRRHSARHGPMFRVEFATPPALSVAVPQQAAPALPMPAKPSPPIPDTRPGPVAMVVPSNPAEQFNVGPTYADVYKQKQDALRNQDEGMLRHLVQQNLKLREQIGELDSNAFGKGV
jgi:hypothetical protein